MKVNFTEEINKESFTGHIILEGLTQVFNTEEFENFLEGKKEGKDYFVNVKLTIDDQEIDIEKFMEFWQSQVDKLIKEKAIDLLEEKSTKIYYLLDDMTNKLKRELNVNET